MTDAEIQEKINDPKIGSQEKSGYKKSKKGEECEINEKEGGSK